MNSLPFPHTHGAEPGRCLQESKGAHDTPAPGHFPESLESLLWLESLFLDSFKVLMWRLHDQYMASKWTANTLEPVDQLTSLAIQTPYTIAFDPDNHQDMYATSFTLNHVVRIRFKHGTQHRKGTYSIFVKGSQLDSPVGIAIRSGKLYVASFTADVILRVSLKTGELLGTFGNDEQLDCPEGMAFAPDGTLFVASFLKTTIAQYEAETGTFLGFFGKVPREMPLPHIMSDHASVSKIVRVAQPLGHEDLVFDWDGNVHVTAYFSNLVYKYNGTSGAVIKWYGGGILNGPVGIACSPNDGDMYVGNYKSNQVLRFSPNGQFVGAVAGGGQIDSTGVARAQRVLTNPSGLAFDPHDASLVVLSYVSGTMTRFNTSRLSRSGEGRMGRILI